MANSQEVSIGRFHGTDGIMPSIDWDETTSLVAEVVRQIDASGWLPTLMIGLSRGGFVPATMIAQRLGVRDLVGIDVQKDNDGKRSIGRFVQLRPVDGHRVLIVDDGIVTGNLLPMTAEEVSAKGGVARTCALISEGRCVAPDYLGRTQAVISRFPWE